MRIFRVAVFVITAAASLSLGILCLAPALFALAGAHDPRDDVFTHFAPVYFIGGGVAMLIALSMQSRLAKLTCAAPGVLAALLSTSLVAPEFLRPSSEPASADAPHQIKLIQFNTWGSNSDPRTIAQWILAQDADVVAVEEPSDALVDQILGHGSYYATARGKPVVIFSRAKPIDTDLPRPRPEETSALARAEFSTPDGPYAVIGIHYTWPTEWKMHQRQADDTYYVLRRTGLDRTILVGDFNSTPWSFSRRREDRRIRLERRTRALPTWPARNFMRSRAAFPFPFLPIDHVYAGSDWRTVSVRRGPRLGSDHYPVIVTLALDQASRSRAPSPSPAVDSLGLRPAPIPDRPTDFGIDTPK
jgi:endonuclease/exonuclease/phosphatase (EEP) superfamily protein YafD